MKSWLRLMVNRMTRPFGLWLSKWPTEVPEVMAFQVFTKGLDTVLDIGANDGGFGAMLRLHGYRGRIVSFEPLKNAFARLTASVSSDPQWEVHNLAFGRKSGQAQINVASNKGASSSFLPLASGHRKAAPQVTVTHQEKVRVEVLDDFSLPAIRAMERFGLKLDVQGFEKEVLLGGEELLRKAEALWIELSLEELYEGAWGYMEAIQWLEARGFKLVQLVPGFHAQDFELKQFDGIFRRVT